MLQLVQKIIFSTELFVNGSFILLYFLFSRDKLPNSLNLETIESILKVGTNIVPLIIVSVIVLNYFLTNKLEEYLRRYAFSFIIFIPMAITWGDLEFCYWLSSAHLLASILALYDYPMIKKFDKVKRTNDLKLFQRLKLSPAQIVLLSFMLLITLGSLLLMLPFSSATGKVFSLTDAIFMATSATCVTGLGTLSLAENFSTFGQVIILILIQIGGLGYMTLYSSMMILLGRSMGMENRIVMQDLLNVASMEDLIGLIVDIIKFTFLIEIWGAIVLTIGFTFQGLEFGKALYYGFFHSISAFCNAGFALFDDNLESFATNPLIHGTIAVLVILGGLGFIVLKEVKHTISKKNSLARMSLHSKVVLITTAILILTAFLAIFFGEFLNALDGFSLWEKAQVAFFQSVTLRTAGFNTVPISNFHSYTIYLMSMFMFIGAGPGSTAGGIKVTTFAILIQSIRSTLRGRSQVEIFNKTLPNQIVVKAMALFIISIITTTVFTFVLMKLEPKQSFLVIVFEIISASGTVGLSLGLTPYLSIIGKITISILMFIARVGPLTLVLAIGSRKNNEGQVSYPEGRIMIG